MSAANRRRGADRELRVRDLYRERGWQAHKTSDSSVVDVIASRPMYGSQGFAELLYIEVKSTLHPYAHFLPDEREALLEAAREAGATPLLFWWRKGIGIDNAREISADEWPESVRKAA